MPKIQLTAEQQRKMQLEAELKDFHNGEEKLNHSQAMRNHNGRRYPVMSEGTDRQEIYDRFGCY